MLKKHTALISGCYTLALLVVSLITLDFGGLETVVPSFGDKIFHFLAYGILTYLWASTINRYFKLSKFKAIIIVFLACTGFGIIIEVLQKVLTNSRHFDYYDIAANISGVILVSLFLLQYLKIRR